jgi:Mu DNA-binding protein
MNMSKNDGFDLVVRVSAEDWEKMKRRVRYLESVVVQICRDKVQIKEWFTASDLVDLRLTGLPQSKAGITRLAQRQEWIRRTVRGAGGATYQYHFYSLTAPAFDDLISRIVNEQIEQADHLPEHAPKLAPPPPMPVIENTERTAAPWMLPLMRVVRSGKADTVGDIMRDLPQALPIGVDCPSVEQVRAALVNMGLI